MSINLSQAEAFRSRALHPNTGEHEARTASMMFCKCLALSDLKESPIRTIAIDPADRSELDSVKEMLRQAQDDLKKSRQDFLAEQAAHSAGRRMWEAHCVGFKEIGERAIRLLAENEQLRAEAAKQDEVGGSSDTGTKFVSFESVSVRAERTFSRKRWMSAFAFNVGLSIHELRAWKTVGIFPAALAMKLEHLTEDQTKPASRQTWTTEESARLKAVLAEGATNLVAAAKLSAEFGRPLHETSIVGARRRIRQMELDDASQKDSIDPEPSNGRRSASRTGTPNLARKDLRQRVNPKSAQKTSSDACLRSAEEENSIVRSREQICNFIKLRGDVLHR
ncbi:hypothetical protein FV218_06460 [Methylobacterium sp. WL69]|uniref:hypothetical protein n=1 Tax=Methylobacterium sp. WL69 TaxID=2603893 RepID=UPI0011CA275D|nr:hypothetical protein [Methylobacterium sp. WL69]TXM76585.1 hypothetical protein FV218_06460 [Methylobacterium sp. WL69]